MSEQAAAVVFGEALVDAFGSMLLPGGAPFNVACHLAALGLPPLLITRLGQDEAGRLLRGTAARFGLSLQAAQLEQRSARVDVREREGGHLFEIPAGQAFDRIEAAAAVRAAAGAAAPGWLYFGTLALREPASRAALAALRASRPRRAFVDLNWRQAGPSPQVILEMLQEIEVLKLSDAELGRVLGWLQLPPIPGVPAAGERRAAMAHLCARLGARHVLVSHGAEGAAAWDAHGCCVAFAPAPPVPRLRDTVGAGDAFSALMLAGLLQQRPLAAALADAVAFASLSCGWRGALPADTAPYRPWRIRPDLAAPAVTTAPPG
ncbi:MAG: fructokinase [Pseudomonadota bacterium]|nr:fructokinase [Pseudomonadota bacterium]